jgi:hypothetical protein
MRIARQCFVQTPSQPRPVRTVAGFGGAVQLGSKSGLDFNTAPLFARRVVMHRLVCAFFVVSLCHNVATAEPIVFSGYDVSFAHSAFADPFDPTNQDAIVDGVVLTRSTVQGIFNAAQESFYAIDFSPAGTQWAFASNNPGQTIAAGNWSALEFEDWQTALGSLGNLATNILDGPGVMHLVDRDIYLDIRFTEWGVGSAAGGSFAYERAAVNVVPEPGGFVLAAMAGVAFFVVRAARRTCQRGHTV